MRTVATCINTKQFKTDVKHLKKKYPSAETDVLYARRLLEAGEKLPKTDPFSGFGNHNIYKTRIYNTSTGKGKSSGYRLIYEEILGGDLKRIVFILLYTKNEFNSEAQIINEVRFRLRSSEYQKLLE